MSRVIQQIASVQFQVQNRQANAAMQALQEAAKDLSKNMDDVNKKIAALGKDIPKDNPQLLNYQNQLRSLDKDLKDVQKAQRDFLRGAKAADQLWKAAQEQNIESLSFRAIKAGQNGLRKRQEGLRPGDAKDMQDWRIIKEVIDEADRVVKQAGADVQHVIQTIREGGKVSEQAMRQTISTLKELKGSVDETDADFGKWGTDLDFMEAKLKDFSEAQRRARGEIVDANDARREMNKLTEEGAAAAKREAEEADRLVQQYKAEGEELARKRGEIKANIEATQQQIDDNHKIIEEKHRQLAADEETFNAEQQGRRTTIDGLKTQAEAERKLADEKSDAAETQRRIADMQAQTTEQLGENVMKLQDQLEVERQMNEERGKSNKQSKEEIRLKSELETTQRELTESKQRENDEQQKYVKLQGEAIEQGNKAAAAENKVADAQSEAIQKQVDFNKKQQEGLDNINQMAQGNQALQQSLDGLNGELEQNSKDYADNATKTAEAEAKKAKARQLSIKTMEDMLAKLKEEYYTEELTAEKRAEHIKTIQELEKAISNEKAKPMLQMMTERIDNISNLSHAAFEETKKFWQAMADGADKNSPKLKVIEENLKVIAEEEKYRKGNRLAKDSDRLLNKGYLTMSEEDIRKSIAAAREYQQTLQPTEKYYSTISDLIAEAENHLKNFGEESLRTARKQAETDQLMRQQLQQGTALTESALRQQQNYWQRLIDDPKTAAENVKKYKLELEKTMEMQRQQATVTRDERAARLGGDLAKYSEQEIREAIEAGKQLMLTYDRGSDKAKEMAQNIAIAEERIKLYDLEAERNARRQAESVSEMRKQLELGTSLTETALKAQQNYWQRLIDDPKTAAESVDEYKKELEKVIDLQRQQAEAVRDERAARLNGNLKDYSETQIREAIEAGKQLVATYKTGDDEAGKLAKKIVAAEEHLKKFGIEAERTAVREAKAIEEANKKRQEMNHMMVEQYNKTRDNMSDAALKANERYWQQLIDDPKTAAENLQEYRDNLEIVQNYIRHRADEKVRSEGESALDFFRGDTRNASADSIKEQANALKKYRDSLPREDDAQKIAEINSYLEQVGATAKTTTDDIMELDKALALADTAGKDGFMATPQEIQQATKAIEKQRDAIIQTIKAKRDSGAATDAEEKELTDLTKKLKDLKFEQDNFNMSQAKMQELMRTPTNAVSLDELKAAIKRADGELKRMEGSLGKNSTKYKEFAAEVKNAKNVMKEMEGQAKASATAWEKAWSRLKTYVGLYMGFNILWQKMMGTADDLMTLSDKMGEVRKTTGFTADEVGRLSDNLKRLDVRTTLTGLMEISAKAGQLGLKTEQDVMGFTEAANKLMIALPEMGAEAATEMMKVALATGEVKKIQDQLNKGIVEGSSATEVALSKIGSTIDQLRANSAAAAPQITDFVKRVGAVGAQSGITIDQIAALGATVDAVGLRVEMSATALSRMIPAIRNNAFEVAKAIGMAPNALREMFDEAGGGMEAMLAIFQHIKDSGMDPDSIEKMLNMGNMQDVMKQLNQQGARAGIVFAGLAQNVDELRKNLGVAAEAYEDNIAILQEYNKMNDTAAGKWERFKNEVEEFFVGDTSQRFLGGLISVLRGALDIFIGSNGWSAALRTIGVYFLAIKFNIAGIFSGVKNISVSLRGIAMAIGLIDKETKKLAWGNIFTALAMAALWTWRETVKLKSALDKASESLGKTKVEVSRSIDRFESYWTKLKSTSEALIEAKSNHEKLSAEVDKLRKSTDGSAESTANLKKKEDELTTSEKNVTKASNDHKGAIAQMNSIYGKYLGFILTESNYSNLAAAAHDKVTAAIEREMLMKQRQAAIGEVDSNYSDNIATGYGNLNERLVKYGQLSRSEAAKVMSDMQRFMRENLKYDAGTNATVVSKAIMDQLERNGLDVSKADANEIAALWFDQYLEENYHLSDNVRQGLTGVGRRSDLKAGWGNVFIPFATNLRGGYAETYAQREQARGAVSAVYDVDIAYSERMEAEASGQLLDNLEKSAQDAKKVILDKNIDEKKRGEAYIELANALEGLDNRINELDPQKDAATINRLNEMAESLKGDGIDIKKLKQAREKINQTLFERATFNEEDIRNLDTTNPWGSSHEASSTDWKNMTAEQLVNRRKQMKDFVNSIQTDSDVKTVLGEDAALKKAIENGMSSDMRTVIEWYNTERLKIQEELYNRHLTNTGDWRDPKSGGSWRKQLQTDFDTYLRILDAYYTERKAKIEKAQTEEGMSEAEAQRLVIENETVWRKHRMELQQIYQGKSADIAKGERQRIYDILAEQDEDTAEMVEKTIGNSLEKMKILASKSEVDYRKVMSKLTKDIATDLYKQQNAVANQMEAIQKIIAQERPFDGLVENLEKNLSTMGILFAELDKKRQEAIETGLEPEDDTAKRGAEATMKRMLVLMQQAEDGYTVTFERLKEVMIKEGFTDWADAIENNDQMRKAMMAMLRKMYDDVHAAIKKESSQIKKELDIWWNDVEGDGKLSRKGGFEKMLSDLGLQEEQVKRANSLIGAGAASERVADKLAIQQMRVRLAMQNAYYAKMRQIGELHVKNLEAEAEEYKKVNDKENYELKMLDAKHARQSLNLSLSEEQTKVLEQQVAIQNQLEESQNRLYEELREWGDLLASSLQSIFEASHAGDAEYYNERAKLNLTGKGGPGAGTYIVIDNEGTSDAQAHYEYLDERQALERQREIENQNAVADAWKKVMDDINMKMSEQITDMLNASLQNAATEANTNATLQNTQAIIGLTGAMAGGSADMGVGEDGIPNALRRPEETSGEVSLPKAPWQMTDDDIAHGQENMNTMWQSYAESGTAAMQQMGDVLAELPAGVTPPWAMTEEQMESGIERMQTPWAAYAEASMNATQKVLDNQRKVQQGEQQTDKKIASSASSAFSKMAAACNMYGLAYQTVTNDNLDASQKFQMFALQAAGQTAIGMLTTDLFLQQGKAKVELPGILGKAASQLGPIAGPIAFAAMTALLGGLMGLAVSQVAKSKSQISQVTGASVGAGRLSTGMLTYAEGNVNEFTDPSTLTPGRSYNVDAADGRTYRAKYTGSNPRTHITNGPEFHLVGEAGREAIIDAKTTRNIQLNEPEIWRSIQTLYNGGVPGMRRTSRMGRGVRAYADGNLDDFEEMDGMGETGSMGGGMSTEMMMSLQASMDRQSDLLERALNEGIKGVFDVHGSHGLVSTYDRAKKEAQRHGVKYT